MTGTERTYDGRISAIYKNGVAVTGPQQGNDTDFTYDAYSVNSDDMIRVSQAIPFRRCISSSLTDRPQIIAAPLKSHCEIDINSGVPVLISVMEQYIAADCT